MIGKISAAAIGAMLAAAGTPADAQTLVEQSAEARMQLDFHVPDAALKAMLPAGTETKFYSSVNPSFYQIFKIDQNLDIMRNATITVADRVKEFQYKASGGKIAALFDGTERVLSIDAISWYNRAISLP